MIPQPPQPGMGGPHPGGAGGVGGAAQPGAMAGNQAQGSEKVMVGLKALQEALPHLELGSEMHQAVLDAVSKIGKHLPQGGTGQGDPSSMVQQLALMARGAKQDPSQANALQGLMGGGGAPPPPGAGGAPPPPMMGA